MPKIPNWSNVGKNEWQHDERRGTLEVVNISEAKTRRRGSPDLPDPKLPVSRRSFPYKKGASNYMVIYGGTRVAERPTLDDARSVAITWMKNHPNG